MAEHTQELDSYADASFALKRHDLFVHGDFRSGVDRSAEIVGESLIALNGDQHFQRRRMEATLFRADTLLAYEQRVVAALRSALDQMAAHPERGADADLVRLTHGKLLRVTIDLVGLDGLESQEHLGDMQEHFERVADGILVRWSPPDTKDTVMRAAFESLGVLVDRFYRPSWARRERLVADAAAGRISEDELPNDLITLMIKNRDYFAQWDSELVLREATLFIHASANTTTSLLPFVVDEMDGWLANHPEDAARLLDPDFLEAAIGEALRLHPNVPALRRQAVRHVELPTGLEVQPGGVVVISIEKASRVPAVFGADAHSFDLHRELPKGVTPYALGFGGGPHACMGRPLVMGSSTRLGTARAVLTELYRRGMRPRPDARSGMRHDTMRSTFDAFPVTFDAL